MVGRASASTHVGDAGDECILLFDAHVEAGDGDDFIYQARKSGQNVGLRLSGGA